MERVDKPWGYELRFIRTDRYAGKLLFIKEGSQLSLQYHEQKDEAYEVLAAYYRAFDKEPPEPSWKSRFTQPNNRSGSV